MAVFLSSPQTTSNFSCWCKLERKKIETIHVNMVDIIIILCRSYSIDNVFFLIYRQNNDGCCPFNLYATSSIIQALTLFCISLALRRIIKHENKRIKMKTKNKKTTMCCVHDCAAVLNAHNACVFITHARTHAHEYEQQVKVTMWTNNFRIFTPGAFPFVVVFLFFFF